MRHLTGGAFAVFASCVLAVPLAGTAHAEIIGPGNPYFWDCGSSRSGGILVEAFGQNIRVIVNPDNGPSREETRSGSISERFDGGSSGNAAIFTSNDGGFGPGTRVYCDGAP